MGGCSRESQATRPHHTVLQALCRVLSQSPVTHLSLLWERSFRLQAHLVTCPAGRNPDVNLEALEAFKKFIQDKRFSEKDILMPAHVGQRLALPIFLVSSQYPPLSRVSLCPLQLAYVPLHPL